MLLISAQVQGQQKRLATGGSLEPKALAHRIVELLSDHQAEDILLLDISKVSAFADYFVIANGATKRQIEAMITIIDESLEKDGLKSSNREGDSSSGWVLLDYGNVIVHLFNPQERTFYDLEELWSRGTPVVRLQ